MLFGLLVEFPRFACLQLLVMLLFMLCFGKKKQQKNPPTQENQQKNPKYKLKKGIFFYRTTIMQAFLCQSFLGFMFWSSTCTWHGRCLILKKLQQQILKSTILLITHFVFVGFPGFCKVFVSQTEAVDLPWGTAPYTCRKTSVSSFLVLQNLLMIRLQKAMILCSQVQGFSQS